MPTHYVFAIDASGSMSGEKWKNGLLSLTNMIKAINNLNEEKNQLISFIRFGWGARIYYDSVTPDKFNS